MSKEKLRELEERIEKLEKKIKELEKKCSKEHIIKMLDEYAEVQKNIGGNL